MIRKQDQRVTGYYREYPGAYAWPEVEYLCCECHTWGSCSDVTRNNGDGTDSPICETCAQKIIAETPEFQDRTE